MLLSRAAALLMIAPLSLPFGSAAIAQSAPVAASEAVSSRVVATKLADMLEAKFVYPTIGLKYGGMLRANAAAGKYDALAGAELAAQLSDDLRAIYPDNHLRVLFGDGPQLQRVPASGAGPKPGGPAPVRMTPPPPMEAARWIAPGIAFVRFNLFPQDAEVTKAAAAFMAQHAGAKAIIFDIRTHRGGGLDQMDVIFPWLFAKPTRLVTMATRKSVDEGDGSPIAGIPSLRIIPADPAFVTREHWATPNKDTRLRKAKIYVLTSTFSGSAAEHFSLAMKHTGRGTLVGSHTGGANHFGGVEDIAGEFSAFIPVGRTYDPKSGKDWEGAGVLPDIEVAPELALIKVLTMEGVAQAEAERLSKEVAPTMPMVRRRPGQAPTPRPQ